MRASAALLAVLLLSGALFFPASAQDSASGAAPLKAVFFPFKEAVISSMVASKVARYKFKEGERFAEGETLALLDDRHYRQAKLKADALFAEAKANLAFTEENFKRNSELFARSAVGKMELEQSRLDRDAANAKLQFAEAGMKLAALDLEACEIKAPFAGRFAKRSLKESEFVQAGQPVLEILDDAKLLAVMHMPSDRRRSLKTGDEFKFKVDETGALCKGSVYEIGGRIDYESRTFEVKVLIDNKDGSLAAGMSGSLAGKPD